MDGIRRIGSVSSFRCRVKLEASTQRRCLFWRNGEVFGSRSRLGNDPTVFTLSMVHVRPQNVSSKVRDLGLDMATILTSKVKGHVKSAFT